MGFEELKARQSVIWGNGPYDAVSETLTDMQELLVRRLQPVAGEQWLDVACGTGRVTELLARTGAIAVGIDLSPALVETARERAAALDLEIEYRVGDCERLDGIDDSSLDGATSAVGIMFAPDHEATAAQLARVLKPGGRLGLASWRAEGGVGDLFRLMSPYQPAPPPSSPFDWGNEARVTELLGEQFELEFSSEDSVYEFPTGEAYWQLMSTSYGPTKTLVESLDEERREELHTAWNAHYETLVQEDRVVQSRTWLLVKGTRR